MQAIPRIFSTDKKGDDPQNFLAGYFPSIGKMATKIFLKGYQWPFDPQRIQKQQSSLIDMLVFSETQRGRRVFMDFVHNPAGHDSTEQFEIESLDPEAYQYLQKADALQATPIERLSAMNPPAIEIYKEHGIDLYSEPLEIAVCAQHNNGGFAVDMWWQSNIPRTFVIGEMAGTHGVKRPGGSALNAGQVGGLRAAEYIVNVYGCDLADYSDHTGEIEQQVEYLVYRFEKHRSGGPMPKQIIKRIQNCMTASAGHIRRLSDARAALKEVLEIYGMIENRGISQYGKKELIWAIRAEHIVLTSIAYLKAIIELLKQGSGSRGSHLVLAGDGIEIHPSILCGTGGKTLRFKPENKSLRNSVLQVKYDEKLKDLFVCSNVELRSAPTDRKAFEPAWRDFREGKIYRKADE